MYSLSNTPETKKNNFVLIQEEKSNLLDPAAKEVGRVLKDNLYVKFRATHEYRHIQDQLYALGEEDAK